MDRLAQAQKIIASEYGELCTRLGVGTVPLDVYAVLEDAPEGATTPLGTSLRNATPGYSGYAKIMVLPLMDGNDWPTSQGRFPPATWNKQDQCWPIWRIELWHEFIHQISDVALAAWDPNEPGRERADRTTSDIGHGLGWWRAVERVAESFGVDPEALDSLVDR